MEPSRNRIPFPTPGILLGAILTLCTAPAWATSEDNDMIPALDRASFDEPASDDMIPALDRETFDVSADDMIPALDSAQHDSEPGGDIIKGMEQAQVDDERAEEAVRGPQDVIAPEAPEAADRSASPLSNVNVYPNPTFGPVAVDAGDSDDFRLRVYNISGREIAEIEGRSGRATWDGRDETGRLAAAGIYFARLEAVDGTVRTVRITRR